MQTSQFLQRRGSLLLSTLLITTLIIPLSTVGFVSFQSYTKDAQSAVIRENIGILTNALNTQWVSMMGDFSTLINTGSVDKTVRVGPEKTIYWESDPKKVITKAWDVEWSMVIGIYMWDMKDQYGNEPLFGYASRGENVSIQVATTIDNQVYIKNNFYPNSWENAAQWLIQDISGKGELVHWTYGKHR